ncbi:MAG: hypothetical protein OXP70_09715, partial [Acidobacteriota bacterium]|nr:hypothetical protein [Acidobacteriota bacterium]
MALADTLRWMRGIGWCSWRMGVLLAVPLAHGAPAPAQPPERPVFHDAHYHPTDYIQQETALPAFLAMMGG